MKSKQLQHWMKSVPNFIHFITFPVSAPTFDIAGQPWELTLGKQCQQQTTPKKKSEENPSTKNAQDSKGHLTSLF